eukprot:scpid91350/ scgid34669/ 
MRKNENPERTWRAVEFYLNLMRTGLENLREESGSGIGLELGQSKEITIDDPDNTGIAKKPTFKDEVVDDTRDKVVHTWEISLQHLNPGTGVNAQFVDKIVRDVNKFFFSHQPLTKKLDICSSDNDYKLRKSYTTNI